MKAFSPVLFVSAGALALSLNACATPQPRYPAAPQPQHAPTVSPPPKPTPKPAPANSQMAPIPNPPEAAKQTPVQPKGATKPVAPRASLAHPSGQAGTDPAKAAKLRTAGLVQLNRGMVDKAVALLQQALALDPSSELIQHDLDRAVRIRQAVQAKP